MSKASEPEAFASRRRPGGLPFHSAEPVTGQDTTLQDPTLRLRAPPE